MPSNSVLLVPNAVSLAVASESKSDGQPVQRFRKELIRTGRYVKDGEEILISQDRIDNWKNQFTSMMLNGVRVPLMNGHSDDADDTRGSVVDMFDEDGSLVAILEAIGEDAIRSVSTNDVSIATEGTFTDGKGNVYEDAITHVALTPRPVVPGQEPAVAFSFVDGKDDDASKAEGKTEKEEESQDENAEREKSDPSADSEGAGSEDSDADKTNLPNDGRETVLKMERENRSLRLKFAIERGHINPAESKKLESLFSLMEGETLDRPAVLNEFLSILETHKAVSRQHQTPPQLLSTERAVSNSETRDWIERRYSKQE